MMNPAFTEALARERYAELRKAVVAARPLPRPTGRHPRPPSRQRLGWLLIEVGLRMATAPR
ncbi:MAG TPA: hypothetical protein VGG05_09140 [Pseudonocardiaceae bacterium]|jgi:hypothetical protein